MIRCAVLGGEYEILGQRAGSMCLRPACLRYDLMMSLLPSLTQAQSFFSTLVTDPAVVVDRSSTSCISKLNVPTTFLTFDTYGSYDIEPSIAGLGFAKPVAVVQRDQLELIGVLAEPSSDSGVELLPGGVDCRFSLNESQTYGFVQADNGAFDLGTAANKSLDVEGEKVNVSFGVKHIKPWQNKTKFTTVPELRNRAATASLLGHGLWARICGSLLGEVNVSHLFDQPIGVVSQDETCFWLRGRCKIMTAS